MSFDEESIMSRKLVAYFSASGTTAKVAKRLADSIDADLFEIKPKEPYTDSDLRWTNPLARCNREKIRRKDVPLENHIENFALYDTIFLGFPIWYYAAPNIIQQKYKKRINLCQPRKELLSTKINSCQQKRNSCQQKPYS